MDAMLGAAALAFENKIAPTAAEETFLATALAGFNTTFEQFTDRWIAVWVGGVVLDVFYFFVSSPQTFFGLTSPSDSFILKGIHVRCSGAVAFPEKGCQIGAGTTDVRW